MFCRSIATLLLGSLVQSRQGKSKVTKPPVPSLLAALRFSAALTGWMFLHADSKGVPRRKALRMYASQS